MEDVKSRKLMRVPDGGFDRKLSDEELRELLDNYDYDPDYDYDSDPSSAYIFDRFGNPTRATLDAFYETEHGLTETVTLEELFAEFDEALKEGQE